ncbi:MAG: hypothetical protein AAF533_00375 [Acidobacteriota bacterium]
MSETASSDVLRLPLGGESLSERWSTWGMFAWVASVLVLLESPGWQTFWCLFPFSCWLVGLVFEGPVGKLELAPKGWRWQESIFSWTPWMSGPVESLGIAHHGPESKGLRWRLHQHEHRLKLDWKTVLVRTRTLEEEAALREWLLEHGVELPPPQRQVRPIGERGWQVLRGPVGEGMRVDWVGSTRRSIEPVLAMAWVVTFVLIWLKPIGLLFLGLAVLLWLRWEASRVQGLRIESTFVELGERKLARPVKLTRTEEGLWLGGPTGRRRRLARSARKDELDEIEAELRKALATVEGTVDDLGEVPRPFGERGLLISKTMPGDGATVLEWHLENELDWRYLFAGAWFVLFIGWFLFDLRPTMWLALAGLTFAQCWGAIRSWMRPRAIAIRPSLVSLKRAGYYREKDQEPFTRALVRPVQLEPSSRGLTLLGTDGSRHRLGRFLREDEREVIEAELRKLLPELQQDEEGARRGPIGTPGVVYSRNVAERPTTKETPSLALPLYRSGRTQHEVWPDGVVSLCLFGLLTSSLSSHQGLGAWIVGALLAAGWLLWLGVIVRIPWARARLGELHLESDTWRVSRHRWRRSRPRTSQLEYLGGQVLAEPGEEVSGSAHVAEHELSMGGERVWVRVRSHHEEKLLREWLEEEGVRPPPVDEMPTRGFRGPSSFTTTRDGGKRVVVWDRTATPRPDILSLGIVVCALLVAFTPREWSSTLAALLLAGVGVGRSFQELCSERLRFTAIETGQVTVTRFCLSRSRPRALQRPVRLRRSAWGLSLEGAGGRRCRFARLALPAEREALEAVLREQLPELEPTSGAS